MKITWYIAKDHKCRKIKIKYSLVREDKMTKNRGLIEELKEIVTLFFNSEMTDEMVFVNEAIKELKKKCWVL